jgi:hypothetical protein
MAWLPVLVACTLLDRNPTNTAAARKALQTFFDNALRQWQSQPRRVMLLPSPPLPPPPPTAPALRPSAVQAPAAAAKPDIGRKLAHAGHVSGSSHAAMLPAVLFLLPPQPVNARSPQFVLAYSGQARRKWHDGVAHSVVARLERMRHQPNSSYALQRRPGRSRGCNDDQSRCCSQSETGNAATAEEGRATTSERQRQRRRPSVTRQSHLDTVEAWQVLAALLVVGPATFGAFVVSYTTTPLGVGCRSGGHLVFILLVTLAFMLDLLGGQLRRR